MKNKKKITKKVQRTSKRDEYQDNILDAANELNSTLVDLYSSIKEVTNKAKEAINNVSMVEEKLQLADNIVNSI